MKKYLIIFITLLLCIYWYIWALWSVKLKGGPVVIPPGTGFSTLLSLVGVETLDIRARLYKKWFTTDFSLKAGTYSISPGVTLEEALRTSLLKPIHTDITITILPGWNKYDIDAYLAGLWLSKAGDLMASRISEYPALVREFPFIANLNSLEGLIFPDTYQVKQWANLEDVLRVTLTEFNRQIYSKILEKDRKNWYATLKLASIVEREERDPAEKPTVAGVLAKRIEIGMTLGADATVCYALALWSSRCTPALIVEGLSSTSPYNTRVVRGLPPTPIASVSRDTWLATINLRTTDSLYYLHAPDGQIYYGKTLEEHNANKRKYLR